MLFYIISSLINALVATILAFVVYSRNKKQLVNKVFSLFCSLVAIWSYAYFAWFLLKDKNLVLLNHRLFLMGASIFIAILFFHSILAFTNKIKQYKKLLEESQKNLDFEQRLRKTYAEIAEKEIKSKYFK